MKIFRVMKKSLAVLTAFVVMFGIYVTDVAAQNIQASDGGALEVTTDGTFVYMNYQGPWSNYLGTQISVAVNGVPVNGSMSNIVLNTGNGGEGGMFQVYNAWGQPIGGAEGTVQNINPLPDYGYGFMNWSIKIPVSAYGGEGISTMSFGWNGGRAEVAINGEAQDGGEGKEDNDNTKDNTGDEAGDRDSNQTDGSTGGSLADGTVGKDEGGEDTGSTEGGGEEKPPVVTSKLTVDGYYGEWSGYPRTEITYNGNNTHSVHMGQLAIEGDRLYAHFSMSDLYTAQMKIQIWNLQINGNTYPLQILPVTPSGDIDWSNSGTSWGEGTHTNFDVFVGYYPSCDGDVAFTIYDEAHTMEGKGDEIEFSLSLERLSEITGVPVDQMSTIRLNNPNIGAEGVEISGTPTGPWLGALAALIIAAGFLAKKRKDDKGLS